jgi:multidrug efflux system outer membrane protein
MNKNVFLLLIGVSACLGGCSMAPQYSRPKAPIPADWPSGAAYPASQPTTSPSDATQPKWLEFFSDTKLQRVVEMALRNNRDLRLAALSVERARALYGIQRAELFPVLNAIGGGSKHRLPADLSGIGKPMTVEQYGANIGLNSWEIDFFGRIRSLTDRALEQYLATEQARRSAWIMLVSEVGTTYLALAADRETLRLAATTLETQRAAYNLVKLRLDRGLVPELDLFRAQTQVDIARGDVARFTQIVAQDQNSLNLLVGSPVPDDLLPAELGSVSPLKEISPGISSEVLLRRPDIVQAEAQLKAANANIGAARAACFPRISLTAAIGAGSDDLSGLFKSGSLAWSYAPQIVVPIFDSRTWSALELTEVEKKSAITQYEKAIQTAFREVADALAVRGTVDEQISAQESLVHASEETCRLSSVRYAKGVDNYLSVLDAQQSLYSAQQRAVTLRLKRLANQVRLYAVLGGGWQAGRVVVAGSQ